MIDYYKPNYGHGPVPEQTMSVEDLIDFLGGYPRDMPVILGFEGMYGGISQDIIKVAKAEYSLLKDTLIIGDY